MRTRRTKEQIRKDAYNKDVDAYNYYVVNLETMRAETGFEYREDAVEVLNDYDDKKKYKVVSKRALKSMGVENPNESFKYEDGGKFKPMTREEFMKKEIEGQKEKEINEVFKKFRVVVYEQKKSGGYPFTDFETDNFIEGVNFAKKMIQQQKNYRPDSDYLWVTISKFTPIEERPNVRYPYYEIARFGEEDLETSKYEFGGDFQSGVYAKGGSLIGNQKRIDLNKNGKIDAEDFKLLRTTMNGGWRKDRKYVNSTSRKDGKVIDYEVNYARKFNPSRKGYKGKTFADGGDVDRFSEYSNNALTDMIINLSRYENTESEIQMVKDILKKRKGENLVVEEEVTYFLNKDGIKVRSMVEPKEKLSEREWAEKHNPRAYEYMGKRNFASGGSLSEYELFLKLKNSLKPNKRGANESKLLGYTMYEKNGEYEITRRIDGNEVDVTHLFKKFFPYKSKSKMATGGGVSKLSFEDWLKKNNIEVYKRTYYWVADDGGNDYMYSGSKGEVMKSLREDYKKSFADGGAFQKLSDKVAKNYEGKRVKPQYQKDYGKVYSKSEAKEVGDKVAGKVKANQKMASGGETKKGARGGIMTLAKKIRKDGEKWTDAVKRAGQQLK